MKEILSDHSYRMVGNAMLQEDRQDLIVRRKHIWTDTKRALLRPFSEDVGINIEFVGEPAIDGGGPLREYFRLLWLALNQNLALFEGRENARVLAHNISAIQQRDYIIVGRCISLAFVYGGSAPHFFSEALVSQLFDEPLPESAIEDIPDPVVSQQLQKVLC